MGLVASWIPGRRGALGLLVLGLIAAGCNGESGKPAPRLAGDGDPGRGQRLTREYGCQACHVIPGVAGPPSMVGTSLAGWGSRTYIAGRLHNTPENLVKWIEDPRSVDPKTAMPDLNVTTQDARDIAAYLLTLR